MGKMHNLFYDSIKEFIDDVKIRPRNFNFSSHDNMWRRYEESDRRSFNGKFADILDKIEKHDVKREASILSGVMGELNFAEFTERHWEYRQRLEEGDIIDVNRYLDGHEKFWCGVKRAWRAKQVVRVYSGFGGNCDKTPQELATSGAACVTLCEILESLGVGVELWAVASSSELFRNWDGGETLIKLKGSDEFSDLGMINFITGTHYVFRNAVFRSWLKLGERDGLECHSNLGRTKEVNAKDIGLVDFEAESAIIVPQMYDVEQARDWLKGLLGKLPGKMEGKKEEGM